MQEVMLISPRDIDRYVDDRDSMVIDIRDSNEYRAAHVRGAVNVPYEEIKERYFPEEKLLVLYCDRGGASMEAGRYLAKQGYQVCSVVGGFMAYRGRNLVFSSEP